MKIEWFILGVIVFAFCFLPLGAEAYQVENLSNKDVSGDFTLGPVKIEIKLNPGEEATEDLIITNRTGHTLYFKIGKEDFEGSEDMEKVTVFLGEEKGRFSLKDWLEPELEEFSLEHGQRMHLGVNIKIPQNAEPGGYYGAVFAASQPGPDEEGQIKVISQVGSLFFIKVNGEVKEEGYLEEFKADKHYYQKAPINFELISRNTGSIHLVPYGIIEIRNILGRKISEIQLDPWFVMPDSPRLRKVNWDHEFLLGMYKATAKINRGYGNIVDEKTIMFFVVPWKMIVGLLAIVILIIIFCRWVLHKFEFRISKK